MAKRFADTTKYQRPFIRELTGPYKLLWDYICLDCNHAGIWIVEMDIAQARIGQDMPIMKEVAIAAFRDKIKVIDNGERWYIPSFVDFQYGPLHPNNRVHNSVLDQLNRWGIKALAIPARGAKDKDQDKDNSGSGGEIEQAFDTARKSYPGTKRGLSVEWVDFRRKHKNWREVVPLLAPAIARQVAQRKALVVRKEFVPEWKHFRTWLSQSCWGEELAKPAPVGGSGESVFERTCGVCGKPATVVHGSYGALCSSPTCRLSKEVTA